jgi:signal transduction histidine kinase
VSFKCVNGDKFLCVAVEDTGCGIKEENLSKLFKLFGFLNASEEVNDHGVGLGLVISEKIVKTLGGEIKVTSTVDVGSVFEFTLKIQAHSSSSHSICY